MLVTYPFTSMAATWDTRVWALDNRGVGPGQSLVVALDPVLKTLTRVWVVSEVGKCLDKKKKINYLLPGRLDSKYIGGDIAIRKKVIDFLLLVQTLPDLANHPNSSKRLQHRIQRNHKRLSRAYSPIVQGPHPSVPRCRHTSKGICYKHEIPEKKNTRHSKHALVNFDQNSVVANMF
jgi:hypothetical protein